MLARGVKAAIHLLIHVIMITSRLDHLDTATVRGHVRRLVIGTHVIHLEAVLIVNMVAMVVILPVWDVWTSVIVALEAPIIGSVVLDVVAVVPARPSKDTLSPRLPNGLSMTEQFRRVTSRVSRPNIYYNYTR